MPNATTMWFKQHPKSTAALVLAVALAILALVSISSFGTPSGW
jgi:hypothetical protein